MKRSYFRILVLSAFLLSGGVTASHAQSIKGVVKSAVDHLVGLDIEGTWDYKGIDVKFESDNLLKKAGGHVAAARIEQDLNEQMRKIGFEPGVTTFTFNEDGTFTNTTNGKKVKGKYTYDSDAGEITLKYLRAIPVKAKVSGTSSKMSLLFETDGFLSLVGFIGGKSGVKAIKALTSVINSYEGMMVGMEFKKD